MHLTFKRLAGVTTGVAAISLALTACAGSPASTPGTTETQIKLAGVFPNTSDPFFASISCGATQRANELHVELKTYNSTNTDANTIASNFQSALLNNPDGIIATPFNNNQFIAQYQQLMQKGVPVVTGSGTQPQAEYKYIFSDPETAPFAEQVKDLIPQGNGSMVFLGGAPGIPPLESRTQPFVKAIAQMRTDLKQLPTDYSGFDVNKATTSVSSLILGNPDLKLVIAADGPDAAGAAAAIKQSGKQGIALIAFDAIPPEVSALKEGTITALIAQAPFQIGRQQVDALVDYLKEHKDKKAVTPAGQAAVPNKLLTKDNVDSPENVDYIYKAGC